MEEHGEPQRYIPQSILRVFSMISVYSVVIFLLSLAETE
jgi:hypothetical protein